VVGVVSESSVVRVFNEGQLIAEIIPEIWLLGNEGFKISGPHQEQTLADLRIVSLKPGQKLKTDDTKSSPGIDIAREN